MGSQLLFLLVLNCIGVWFSPFFTKLMGSRTHCSKIDRFLGTHETHANGATAVVPACSRRHGAFNKFANEVLAKRNFTYIIRSWETCPTTLDQEVHHIRPS